MRETLLISDMKVVVPEYSISSRPEMYKWRVVEYETKEFTGSLLISAGGSKAPALEVYPKITGWYKIYIGIWKGSFAGETSNVTKFKLSGNKLWRNVNSSGSDLSPAAIMEVLFDVCDMTDQSVQIANPDWGESCSCVAFLKFVPMPNEEVEALNKERSRNDTKRIIGTHDMHALFYYQNCDSTDEFLEEVEAYKYSDIEKLFIEYLLGGDTPDSRFNEMSWTYGNIGELFPRPGDERYCHNMRKVKGKNKNPYKAMVDYAHEIGIKMYMSYRMNAFASEPPFDSIFTTKFYEMNPHMRCMDRDGSEICRMSYAYEEVQNRIIDYFLHMCETGCDGIAMLFGRCFPYICYEAPSKDLFIKKYGIDPCILDTDDDRWLDCKAEIMTNFLCRVRKALDEYSTKNSKARLAIAVYMMANEKANRMYGLDGETWAKEGLIDDIVAFATTDDLAGHKLKNSSEIDISYYGKMQERIKDTGVKIYCDIMPRSMEPAEYKQRALEIYKNGLDGLSMWDTYQRHRNRMEWSMASRLGHKEELHSFGDGDGTLFKKIPCIKIGGYRVDRYQPKWGL